MVLTVRNDCLLLGLRCHSVVAPGCLVRGIHHELGRPKPGERLSRVEAIVKEQTNGQYMCARIEVQRVKHRWQGILENQRWCLLMATSRLRGDHRTQSHSVEDDARWR